jgi:hypothetical protein
LAELFICEKRYGDTSSFLSQAIEVLISLYGEKEELACSDDYEKTNSTINVVDEKFYEKKTSEIFFS